MVNDRWVQDGVPNPKRSAISLSEPDVGLRRVAAFPLQVLVLAIIASLGPGTLTVYVAIVSSGWIVYARIMRAQIMVARSQQYVEVAEVLGLEDARILGRHMLPNTVTAALVYAMSDAVLNLYLLAALS